MDQLGLQLLQPRLGLLPLGQVADEAGEEALVARAHLADRKLHREGRAVLALADHDAADADDAPLAGRQVAREIAVVALAVGRRHQHLDVLADHLRRRIAEQPLGGALKDWMIPCSSMTIMASGTVSRIDCRCASRARMSLCGRLCAAGAFRRSRSPNQAMPMPTRANVAALMRLGVPTP